MRRLLLPAYKTWGATGIKRKQVEDAFFRIGKINDPPVWPVIASREAYHYRAKAQCHQIMTSSWPSIGFLDISGSKVVDIKLCKIMHESINEKMGGLRKKVMFQKRKEVTRMTVWSELPGG
jgi:tRNA/tmRNA/rRNA uracil-C5-methylase (TrmA/RlmC/RlmD family)